jgi:hypothetical protein
MTYVKLPQKNARIKRKHVFPWELELKSLDFDKFCKPA